MDGPHRVLALETEGGTLATTPTKRVTVDGEIRHRTPIRFAVAADALRVMVPAGFVDRRQPNISSS